MTKQVRVNIRTLANVAGAREEERNGRKVIVVPSATLPDNIVMNGVRYPADEIEKSYMTLNRKPAPLGHPEIDGKFLSASDPEAINSNWVGAWNENVRRENGRVYLDKVIDVETAGQTANGKRLLNAIEKNEPVHTSTGLFCLLDETNGEKVARSIDFDHDAILLDQEGAAVPDQGVGMFVNSSGEDTEIPVINSYLEDAERDLAWAAEMAVRAGDKMKDSSRVETIISAVRTALGLSAEQDTSANKQGDADMADDKQLNELTTQVNEIATGQKEMATTIANAVTEALKPVVTILTANAEAAAAATESKHKSLVNKVVELKIEGMTEEVANKMADEALDAIINMHKAAPKKAAPISGGMGLINSDEESLSPLLQIAGGKS